MALPSDFQELLRSETDRIEWKQSTGQRDGILRAVGALANDLADSKMVGYLVIGVEKAGGIRGIETEGDLDQQQKDLADRLRSSKIQPVPSATATLCVWQSKHLLLVQVDPYPVPPVVEVDGQAWVRIGTTTRRANQADMVRLTERRPMARAPFDTRPFHGATLDDVDTVALSRTFESERDGLRNLVQHRLYEGTHAPGRVEWYDDRVEFSNPGGPFQRASEGEFGEHADYRNPLLTARLVATGYVQQLGRGVRRARLQLEKNGNPPLEVETDGFTRIVVRRRP